MSAPEIEEEVRHELDDNPALDATADDNARQDTFDDTGDSYTESAEQLQAADYRSDDDTPSYLLHAANRSADDTPSRYELREDTPSLVEDINSQLDMVDADARSVALARYLAGYLDANGRITRSLTDIADDISINTGHTITRSQVADALDIIKYHIDPPGMGAVDLRECLLIQLNRRTPRTLAIRTAIEIVGDNFDLFSKKHFDRLRTALGVDDETFESAIDLILSLDPKPGGSLAEGSGEGSAHITPDFIVTADDDTDVDGGRFSVTLNQHIPALTVEQSFTVDPADPASRIFIRRKRDEATTFIGLIERRASTLIAVMQSIVAIQHRFFVTEDSADIRPMILKDIATATGLDISIVSRATSTKYVATAGGIYPLKMFFNDRPTDDSDMSSAEIMAALRAIIDGEDKRRPLSDRVLTQQLNNQGYPLARRTVAKYREKLDIPVARLRKEYKTDNTK